MKGVLPQHCNALKGVLPQHNKAKEDFMNALKGVHDPVETSTARQGANILSSKVCRTGELTQLKVILTNLGMWKV